MSGDVEAFLKKLQEVGVVDITRSTKPVDEKSETLSSKAGNYRKALSLLKNVQPAEFAEKVEGDLASNVIETINEIEVDEAQVNQLAKEWEERQPWGKFDVKNFKKLEEQGIKLHFYKVKTSNFNPEWKENYALSEISNDGITTYFVIVSDDANYEFPLKELPAPDSDASTIEKKIDALRYEIEKKYRRLAELKCHEKDIRKELDRTMSKLDLHLAHISGTKAAEDYITVFEGFAPTENDATIKEMLDNEGVLYLSDKAKLEDNPPIKLKNRWFGRMFEVFTGMYGLPVYNEFDPTPVLGPFFLLFFAMCMGDAGYGILLYIIGCFLKGKEGGLAKSWRLIKFLGVSTFVVGILLGTFFGIDLYNASWVPQWLKSCMIKGNISGFDIQMVLALGIGVFHICLAMVIKAINNTKRFGIKESLGVWGWTLLIVGSVIVAALALALNLPMTMVKWIVIVLAAVSALGIFLFNKWGRNPLLNIGVGLWDTYQTATGLLGDVLSYIRLYALGLAGGMLGSAFNNLGLMLLGDNPTIEFLPCILILVIGHGLNLAMSCLGAFVHPLRLTFVEYFKNSGYEGKGVAYHPLKNN